MIVNHGFIVELEEVYICDFGLGVKAGASAACEDYAFHDFYLSCEDFYKMIGLKYLNKVVLHREICVFYFFRC